MAEELSLASATKAMALISLTGTDVLARIMAGGNVAQITSVSLLMKNALGTLLGAISSSSSRRRAAGHPPGPREELLSEMSDISRRALTAAVTQAESLLANIDLLSRIGNPKP